MGSSKWWGVTDWYIDPAQTHGGSDENDGLNSSTPIKSMAEWRRRVRGAIYSSIVRIHALSGSTNLDDGHVLGVRTMGFSSLVVIVGVPTVVGTGTLTGSVSYSGNTRGTVTDSALPTSWTSSYGISSTSGSRYIRRVGGAGAAQATLLQETTPKTVTIGIPTDTSETPAVSITVASAPFSNGDTYEVTSRLSWPQLVTSAGCHARLQCLDIFGGQYTNYETFDQYVLCGAPTSLTSLAGQIVFYNCGFFGSSVVSQMPNVSMQACSFFGTTLEFIDGADLANADNVFLAGARINNHHAGTMRGLGTMRVFDNASALVECARGARVNSDGAIVGSGNTGKLVLVFGGGVFTGAATITATTSDALPYSVTGSNFATPTVNSTSGDAIYA